MKKSALVISLSIASVVLILVLGLGQTGQKKNLRLKHEDFLLKAGKEMKNNVGEKTEENPSCDRPDEAAFAEFVRTMDPALQRVPAERRFSALQETRDMTTLKSGGALLKWESLVADMGGRTRTLMFDPNDPAGMAMFAGSVTGGLWYNENPLEEQDWMPVNDFWSDLSISSMCYDPNNTQIMYLGTGESETALIVYRESSGRGNGLYCSRDGGKQWDLLPSTSQWAYVTDVEVRVENGLSVLYAGVVSGYYKGIGHRSSPSDGLYRSTDQGVTWNQVLPNIPGTNTPFAPSDICFSADRSRIFVGTTYGINSNASDNDRSGAACILYSDDGLSWTVNREYLQAILQKTEVNLPGRVMIAEAPSDPDIMYAIIASGYPAGAFYGYGCEYLLKTTDKGNTWTELNFPQGFASLAWHAFTIAVNPQDPGVIWLGGLDTYRSLDGGANWAIMSNWALMYGNGSPQYVHGDIHQILHHPLNGRMLFVATDGGIFATGSSLSPDNVNFHEINQNYNTLQYYTCAISPVEGDRQFIGGLQDNGTMHYKPGDVTTFTDMLSGGDGAYCFFDPDNPTRIVTCSQYSTIYIYRNQSGQDPLLVGAAQTGLGIFINPMDYDWGNDRLYMNVSYFDGSAANLLAVVNIAETGITGFIKNIGTHTQVPFTAFKWTGDVADGGSLFLGTASGQLYRLDQPQLEEGTAREITGTNFPVGYLSSIETGQSADTLLVTLSNYGIPSVFISTDAGTTWKNIEGNLPDMPVRYGIFHPQSAHHALIATETGIWGTTDALAGEVSWTPQVTGMANVRVDMIKVRPSDLTVVAATHGRGLFTTVWDLSQTSGIEQVISGVDMLIYPNPSSGEFKIRTTLRNQGLLTIRDVQGRLVRSISLQPGEIDQTMDLRKEGKGTYFIRIESLGQVTAKQLIVR
ncbi:MAG: T9SS type A sorting domain-containing protein [Bacteroidota bacterium]